VIEQYGSNHVVIEFEWLKRIAANTITEYGSKAFDAVRSKIVSDPVHTVWYRQVNRYIEDESAEECT
jgi:hypothetical protein